MGYTFDALRLEYLDGPRHDIVHGQLIGGSLAVTDAAPRWFFPGKDGVTDARKTVLRRLPVRL